MESGGSMEGLVIWTLNGEALVEYWNQQKLPLHVIVIRNIVLAED